MGGNPVKISQEKLTAQAELTGFRTDVLEKVAHLLLDEGKIDSTILTDDPILQKRIQGQPLLEWKAINVRKHKGLS